MAQNVQGKATMNTYFKGNEAEYTGNTAEEYGAMFYEVRLLEGYEAGKLKYIVRPPTCELCTNPTKYHGPLGTLCERHLAIKEAQILAERS